MRLYTSKYRENHNNTLYRNETEITGIDDLKAAVSKDHIAAKMKEGHRSSDDFLQADCIMLDLDNTHCEEPTEWKTIDDIAEAFPDVPFYYIQSRNYMKTKTKTARDGKVTYYEPREKYHCYFPLAKTYSNFEEYEKLMLTAAGLFPFFDLGAAKPAQFFYGVATPAGGEVPGSIVLDQYIAKQPTEAVIDSVKDFSDKVRAGIYKRSSETEKAVSRLFNFFGIAPDAEGKTAGEYGSNNKAEPIEQYSSFGGKVAQAEQTRSVNWFKTWAAQHNIPIGKQYKIKSKEHPDAICICVPCPWEEEHSMNGAENESVVIIDLGGKLSFLCRHSHGAMFSWKDYRAYYEKNDPQVSEATAEQNETAQEENKTTQKEPQLIYDSESKSFKVKKEPPKLTPRTAAELDKKDIPPIQWIVTDMLPTGLSVVAAPPKSYKSFFALDMCARVSRGADFFGHKTVKTGCLYFDLESGDRRPRDRLRMILGDAAKPDNLYLITAEDQVKRIGEGFEEQLNGLLDDYKNIRLVVIDVFQIIKPPKKRGMDAYEADYIALGALNSIAKKRDICIMLIHHTKKGRDPSDVFNNMSGSTAMAGAMDTIFIISRENRTDDDAILTVSGRDIVPQELAIQWDRQRFCWNYLGTQDDIAWNKLKAEYDSSDVVATIKHLLRENGGEWSGTADEIVQFSYFTPHHINISPEKLGREINKYEELLWVDRIKYSRDRSTRKRILHFVLS